MIEDIVTTQCCNHPKTLSGIETSWLAVSTCFALSAVTTPKPFQGLKRGSARGAAAQGQQRCNHPKTLSGIETSSKWFLNFTGSAVTTPKPFQGLKLRSAGVPNDLCFAVTTPKPFQGLKRSKRLTPVQADADGCNHPKTLSGIETENADS